jgi:glycosyltransferase involved in cell wall biosynthesis
MVFPQTQLKKIIFLSRSMDYGGAERQIALLAIGLKEKGYSTKIVVFYGGGPLEQELSSHGVPVIHLNKKNRWDILGFLTRLMITLRREQPDILHGYLDVPNILTVLMKPFLPHTRIVWGIRTSKIDLTRYDWLVHLTYHAETWLSKWADLIINNSYSGMAYASQRGLPKQKMIVIPNGIDTSRFHPDPIARVRVRLDWKVSKNEYLIGSVARFDPIKGHSTFLEAASLLIKIRDDVRFVCVGDGPESYKSNLQNQANKLGITEYLIWAGSFDAMPDVYNAFDFIVSSSISEGFPNVVGEAMACGVPSVVTDVGDSARIVGETGLVVPSKSPEALETGMLEMLRWLEKDQKEIAFLTSQRIIEEFSVTKLIDDTTQALESLF